LILRDNVLSFDCTLSSLKTIVTESLPCRLLYVMFLLLPRSTLGLEVGCPRIDSTCFFDIPSSTSSTFAFVMRLPGLHETPSASRRTSKNRETDRSMFICRILP